MMIMRPKGPCLLLAALLLAGCSAAPQAATEVDGQLVTGDAVASPVGRAAAASISAPFAEALAAAPTAAPVPDAEAVLPPPTLTAEPVATD